MLLDDSLLYAPRIFCNCDYCGEPIYYGEKYLEINDDFIHLDCKYEYMYSDRMEEQFMARIAGE
jgi:hypothetical protein